MIGWVELLTPYHLFLITSLPYTFINTKSYRHFPQSHSSSTPNQELLRPTSMFARWQSLHNVTTKPKKQTPTKPLNQLVLQPFIARLSTRPPSFFVGPRTHPMSVLEIIRKLKEKDHEIRLLILGLDNAGKTTVLQRFLNQPIDNISPTVGFNIKTVKYQQSPPQQRQQEQAYEQNGQQSHPTHDLGRNSPQNNHCSPQEEEQNQPTPPQHPHHQQQSFSLTIWDVGGQSTIRSFWSNYFANTDGLIWVIDSTDSSRFDICIKTLQEVLKQERLSGTSVLILANKQDVPFAYTTQQLSDLLGLEKIGLESMSMSATAVSQMDHFNKQPTPQTDDYENGPSPTQTQSANGGHHQPGHSNMGSASRSMASTSSSHHWFIHGCSALSNQGIQEGFDELINDIIKRIYALS